MSFKKLSIVTVFFFVALLLLFYPSPTHFPKTSLTVSQVLAAATQNITKRVASLTIQDQQVDLNDPNATVNITLSADSPSVPIVITYDDGQTRYLAYTFNYKPPAQPAPAFCSNEDFATACWQGAQCQEENQESADTACSQNHGAGSVCTRSTGQPNTHDDGCTIATELAPPPPDGEQCENRHIRNECIACNSSQKVYQRFCDGQAAGDPYAAESQSDFACSDWCGGGGGSSCTPNCSQEPNVCSGEIFNDGCGGTCVGSKDCAAPPECEDVYYCDNGTTIHKHGYHDGNSCQYAWDDIGEPC